MIFVLLAPAYAGAQVYTPPRGVGAVTFAGQRIDNTGHIANDGTFKGEGTSVTASVLAEIDYGVTDRLAATVSIPFVFARYTGVVSDEKFPQPPSDKCQCWQQSFQDFSIAGRYRLGTEIWSLTPQVRVFIPSHDYPYTGEAVVGPNLNQVLLGISGSWRFAPALPNASIQAGYVFALVEKAVEDFRTNRSNLALSFGYYLTDKLYVHGGALYQKTHDGLTTVQLFDSSTPLYLKAQRDRILKVQYGHLIGGVSYSLGSVDLFVSVEPYVWGRNAHSGIAYTAGTTWNLVFPKRDP